MLIQETFLIMINITVENIVLLT